MYEPKTIQEIQRLLAAGNLSKRQIAKQVGVGRATVDDVATGKRRIRRPPHQHDKKPSCQPQRCPACRRVVLMPCLACQLRWLRLAGLIHPAPPGPEDPLRLKLRPEHQKRYEVVMARREAKRHRKSRAKVKEHCP